jgi:hypothetical protein
MSGIVDDLKEGLDDILGIRDDIGAAKQEVYFLEYEFSGTELGDGTKTMKSKERMLPTPRVVEFKHQLGIKEGGAVKQGDILLKMVSKAKYPDKATLEFSGLEKNVEKFYEIGGRKYRPIEITEKHLTWSILCRPLSGQR